MARFCSLFSSSSGNCTYIGGASGGILVDVGVSAKKTEEALRGIGVDIGSIGAVFITHEHTDHINGLRVFASRYGIDVYASSGTAAALDRLNILNGKFRFFEMPSEGAEVCSMKISAFRTSHDAAESVGYCVTTSDLRKISVATDTGIVTEEIMTAVSGSDLVLLESNHDVGMLENGIYPYYLKRRVLSDKGHLSNDACASAAAQLVESGTTRLVLGHLSHENNYPRLALQVTRSVLAENGARENEDYLLSVAGGEGVMTVL